jgi:lipopolysaccharide/colanic/teichoic acid biosynthesis glycosyltransferase
MALPLFKEPWMMMLAATITGAALCLTRTLGAWFLRTFPQRFVAVGPPTPAIREIQKFCGTRPGLRYESYFRFSVEENVFPAQVIVSAPAWRTELMDTVKENLPRGVRIVDEICAYESLFGRCPVSLEPIDPEILIRRGPLARWDETIKRAFDILVVSVALIPGLPLMAMMAGAVKWTSRGPVFFRQRRFGKNREVFEVIKFRTMVDAPTPAKGAFQFTRPGDARVTPVGKILRRLHLDELPQLINILKGEMSLVGPRPEMMEFAQKMNEEIPVYKYRYQTAPGLSGIAQITQGYAMSNVEDTLKKLSYDLYYMRHRSVALDLAILVRTVFFVWGDNTHKNR